MMARNSNRKQSTEGYQYQEAAFEAFMCPLTKQVMQDPVTMETGQTFEREAILKCLDGNNIQYVPRYPYCHWVRTPQD